MPKFSRLLAARSETNQRSPLFTIVLAGFAALTINMLILLIDTSGLATRWGVDPGLITFLWALIASFAIISIHVLAVQRGLTMELRILRKEAEAELSRSQDRFVASVSHALRSPLTGIVGFGHLMREAANTPDGQFTPTEFIDPIIAESVDLSRMVDDLLMGAKLDTNTLITAPEDISLAETVRTAVTSTRDLGFSTALEFEDARIVADPGHLRHVIRNLVVNAHRHGRGPVGVRSRVHGDRCLIEVVDKGPGVPVEDEPWLFAKVPTERWSPSLGLGLEVAARLCERMDAEISYRRVKGETRFRVAVPLAVSDSRHNQFVLHGNYIRNTLLRMGLIGNSKTRDNGRSLTKAGR